MHANGVGVQVPRILLPKQNADFYRWAIVACDQYTSQPEYWEQAEEIVGNAPSTLHIILPEAYLGKPEEEARIKNVKERMRQYLDTGVLEEKEPGFVFVRREAEGKERVGLVMALDLEHYDYSKGAATLIRATEGTVVDRIPPRLRIREGAAVELPHILVLIDDPNRTVIEPIAEKTADMELLYDTDLMLNGGHITGHHVKDPALIQQVIGALSALADKDAFQAQYGQDQAPMLFAMGDGNHSFATAKAAWENIKLTLSPAQWEDHPARYALVEVENIHDEGIVFEPIHRILFDMDPAATIAKLGELLTSANGKTQNKTFENREALLAFMETADTGAHILPYYYGDACGAFVVHTPAQQLCVGTLQNAIDDLLKKAAHGEVDYIHGEDVLLNLAKKENAIGFLLPSMAKSDLFKTVVYDGALPRKTFSMGNANEKRYYLECRRILP